jgi:hypothetical protein
VVRSSCCLQSAQCVTSEQEGLVPPNALLSNTLFPVCRQFGNSLFAKAGSPIRVASIQNTKPIKETGFFCFAKHICIVFLP